MYRPGRRIRASTLCVGGEQCIVQARQQMRPASFGYFVHTAPVARGQRMALAGIKVTIGHDVAGDDDMLRYGCRCHLILRVGSSMCHFVTIATTAGAVVFLLCS